MKSEAKLGITGIESLYQGIWLRLGKSEEGGFSFGPKLVFQEHQLSLTRPWTFIWLHSTNLDEGNRVLALMRVESHNEMVR